MKRWLTSLLVCAVLFSCANVANAELIAPCGINGNQGVTGLSLSGQAGIATFWIMLEDGVSVESAQITIQKEVNGVWCTIKTCAGTTGNCNRFSVNFTAPTGYNYKAYTRYTIVASNGARESYVCHSEEYSN